MLQQVFTASIELLINKVLALNTEKIDLKKLEQKTLSIFLSELKFPISLTINANKILVSGLTENVDCTVKTSIKTLQVLKAEQQLTELIKQNKLDLTGDIKVAQQFMQLAESLNIDWQSELASHIGDVPTHKLMQLGKRVAGKLQFASKQIKADASEYLVHEQRLVVTRSELEAFNQQVSQVSKHVDNISTRLDALTKGYSNT
ncbi:SCP2 sterol-binding domain-containing protein [Colwellia sp. 4_MG-2023]|jgi:ubiquinone biosynthesis protein UbiJ|uniref:ubiquinone biosynthesis accessory factor UbiJ n=1 Tax=unclassified Colwellia TaxID=196834 RepID=UPI001C08E035|nr:MULTISPECIES: SCP2 sterol-binding domain-containing protein [unclassified Colwellia]MBU2924902.1 SCP2 sterol-binding domain-containing protein [Colwellia sp. C2M11]MDO6487671.1 SCP2 sterol-binding domain-containing protein [Colwellia sp. 6_MG-2023]MDO6506801.1 SCP2 sterol-binding domain-containing protein [Colwellia sp. 5_MG-2023]MDO6555824.1 SCP2 sterol-binding domain-containing protein [Colwellia sp. 4_MG-2023]MDO6652868.1 SCP2 sterol-binding domain-containing protein [Colwellia sp. 3_MG-